MGSEGETPQDQPEPSQVSRTLTTSIHSPAYLPNLLHHHPSIPSPTPTHPLFPLSLPLLPYSPSFPTPPPLSSLLFPSRYLMAFLRDFAQYSELTKMNSGNIAIVFGPNLLWSKVESSDPAYVTYSCYRASTASYITMVNNGHYLETKIGYLVNYQLGYTTLLSISNSRV